MPRFSVNKPRYVGDNIPEIFLVDLHSADGIRVTTCKSKEAVMNLVTEISAKESGKTTIDCIQKYTSGTYELVEMNVVFQAGRLMLIEKV